MADLLAELLSSSFEQKKPKVVSVSNPFTAKSTVANEKCPTENDHLFLLKNISFCGYHPKNEKYVFWFGSVVGINGDGKLLI